MNAWSLLFIALLLAYVIYGIVKTMRNKNLSPLHKLVWIIVIVSIPLLGTSAYLRSSFTPRRF
ncbi:PLDc N-terminal domain-containing protein [Pedobacter steynii]|uniref:PLDc N-terminal domain-containing protein n=1 Tax=Pedobacter steynii TaxID=430522 RepID=UPI001428D28E